MSGRCGYGEAVFEHQKARDLSLGGERQYECKCGVDQLSGGFDPRLQVAEDDSATVVCKHILNAETDAFDRSPYAAYEIEHGLAAFLVSDPRQHACVAGNVEVEIGCTQRGDLIGARARAHFFKELLGEAKVLG